MTYLKNRKFKYGNILFFSYILKEKALIIINNLQRYIILISKMKEKIVTTLLHFHANSITIYEIHKGKFFGAG